ncbi:ABC transporter permease [Sulfitobacter pseudonitzschiae]|uniref:ABC transporter permease n=1 Tax=Pseudosulfitobacter pseudonitzschiae TaxID=1402135 RepID=A0A9Q2RTW7_9RHOB|nr:ABC transporter permease [Pseudosulfitobacter pseudonitzschiae]GLT11983.1 ABC transporter permease [Sulfitobacter porphyrae]MBM2293885.1 ABC transporter permease [Pseudosulfitobacter pseudonitzschiae]MBM2298802.1 ABC transporter permease [Pseudosulfitobacter pseudonitzschiae]MBM2303716.1 ABC transporter permease [Pseudosulfitobacter pseudonitzschiae]MBM2313499.1 ABC transporter permease [Pseudosulfitobacter pseudonitzschiae]|tara:strand:+ start:5585 stop:6511 length:927 start_codon:yes stop_codon:yes gene_type:complete
MIPYLIRVAVKSVVTLFAIATITFIATRLSGNPIDTFLGDGLTEEGRAELIRYFQLDGSLWQQYLAFMRGAVSGEFGLSFVDRRPVTEVVGDRLWASGQLLLASVAFTLLVAIPLGILGAIFRKSWIGSAVMMVAFAGYAVPSFILAIVMVLVFSYWLNWLPVVGNGSFAHFIMPTIAMSGVLIAALTRFTRNAMLDVLGQDFIRTARAKGLSEARVVLRHGLGNAGVTVISVIGLQVAGLAAAGSVVVESIFSWPGIGQLLVNAALVRDYPVLQFGVITVAVAVVAINAITDVSYALADPRIRLARS